MGLKASPAVTITGVDKMASAIGAQDQEFKRRIAGVFYRTKPDAETYAKTNAPWTDRTGNARAGLHADVTAEEQGNIFQLLMAHTVFYGVFLEHRFSGRYAILMPTINHIGPLLMQRIEAAIARSEAAA